MNKANIIIKKIDGEEVKLVAKIVSTEASAFKVLDDEKGIFEAYVSVFGNVDSYGEIVDKGAFKDWLAEYGGRYPKGVWAHDWSEPIIKTLECREDERGLYVKGQFVLAVQRAAEIYALMKEGVITDFSFGFRVLEDYLDPATNARHLKKIAIYEYSPVLVGANSQATLIGVKTDGETVDAPADGGDGSGDGSGDAPKEGEDTTASGDSPAPAEATPSPEAGADAGAAPTGDSPAGDDDAKGLKAGRVLSAKNRSAIESAVEAMRSATDALEALLDATEDDDSGKSSDTSKVETHEGKGSPERLVVRGILRDARKADKILEKVIVRAKTITN